MRWQPIGPAVGQFDFPVLAVLSFDVDFRLLAVRYLSMRQRPIWMVFGQFDFTTLTVISFKFDFCVLPFVMLTVGMYSVTECNL